MLGLFSPLELTGDILHHITSYFSNYVLPHVNNDQELKYRSGTVNSKSFVGKVLLRIKWKFELTVYFKYGIRNFQRLFFFSNSSDYKFSHKETMAMMTTLCDKC